MAYVLDASVTAVWAMGDEAHPIADLAWRALDIEKAWVPPIWWYQIRNILLVNERRRRITTWDSDQFLRDMEAFPIELDRVLDTSRLSELARQYSLTVYDAAYLELALRRRLRLATLDKTLRAAAEAAGIPLLT